MKNKKKGYALLMVLAVFTILILIGSTLLTISLYDTRNVAYQEKKTKAYYAAYSGANSMASYIISHPDEEADLINKTGKTKIGGNNVEIEVKKGKESNSLLISASGVVNSISPVHVNLLLEKKENPVFKYTIFGKSYVDINGTTINGDVGTNASDINIRDKGKNGGEINGECEVNLGIDLPLTNPSIFQINPYFEVDKLRIKDNDKIYIKTQVLDDYKISKIMWDNAAHARNGKAQVHLFASKELNINDIDPPEGIILFLYYNGSGVITDNNGKYSIKHCFIYAPNATFSKNGGGNGDYLGGGIIVDKCILPNSSKATIEDDPSIDKEDIYGAKAYVRKEWSE